MGVTITITATSVQPEQQPITKVLQGDDSEKVLFDAVTHFIDLVNREDVTVIVTKKEMTTEPEKMP